MKGCSSRENYGAPGKIRIPEILIPWLMLYADK
jgi:hypothetical protein